MKNHTKDLAREELVAIYEAAFRCAVRYVGNVWGRTNARCEAISVAKELTVNSFLAEHIADEAAKDVETLFIGFLRRLIDDSRLCATRYADEKLGDKEE